MSTGKKDLLKKIILDKFPPKRGGFMPDIEPENPIPRKISELEEEEFYLVLEEIKRISEKNQSSA